VASFKASWHIALQLVRDFVLLSEHLVSSEKAGAVTKLIVQLEVIICQRCKTKKVILIFFIVVKYHCVNVCNFLL
jgi:hypothetical protein